MSNIIILHCITQTKKSMFEAWFVKNEYTKGVPLKHYTISGNNHLRSEHVQLEVRPLVYTWRTDVLKLLKVFVSHHLNGGTTALLGLGLRYSIAFITRRKCMCGQVNDTLTRGLLALIKHEYTLALYILRLRHELVNCIRNVEKLSLINYYGYWKHLRWIYMWYYYNSSQQRLQSPIMTRR